MFCANELNGKMLMIDSIHVEAVSRQLVLTIDAYIDGIKHRIVFWNVSALKMDNVSYPMQISGLAVMDHSEKGWSSDVRYEVCDFEDGHIRFFCGEITLDKGKEN